MVLINGNGFQTQFARHINLCIFSKDVKTTIVSARDTTLGVSAQFTGKASEISMQTPKTTIVSARGTTLGVFAQFTLHSETSERSNPHSLRVSKWLNIEYTAHFLGYVV